MRQMGLNVIQRVAYKVTTKRKHGDAVADNLLNQNFNPPASNQVWAGDVTYCRTGEGWMYQAVVMDLHSLRIVGWCIDKRLLAGKFTGGGIGRRAVHGFVSSTRAGRPQGDGEALGGQSYACLQ